jgi:hypothetical protein
MRANRRAGDRAAAGLGGRRRSLVAGYAGTGRAWGSERSLSGAGREGSRSWRCGRFLQARSWLKRHRCRGLRLLRRGRDVDAGVAAGECDERRGDCSARRVLFKIATSARDQHRERSRCSVLRRRGGSGTTARFHHFSLRLTAPERLRARVCHRPVRSSRERRVGRRVARALGVGRPSGRGPGPAARRLRPNGAGACCSVASAHGFGIEDAEAAGRVGEPSSRYAYPAIPPRPCTLAAPRRHGGPAPLSEQPSAARIRQRK